MKLAVKIVNILNIIVNAVGLILVFALQGVVKDLIKDEAARGELIVNGERISSQDVEPLLNVVPVLAGFVAFLIIVSIVVLALNLYFISKDNLNAILVVGIVHLVFGAYLLGILDIVYYVMNRDKQNFVEVKPEDTSINDSGNVGF
jgi:hypothetical protein